VEFKIDDFLDAQPPHLWVSPNFVLANFTCQETLPVSLKIKQIICRDYDSVNVCMTVADVFRNDIEESKQCFTQRNQTHP